MAHLLLLAVLSAWGADTVVVLEGQAPDDTGDHFFVPFQVPDGIAEIEVHLDDGSAANILDWGLYDPGGWRGWGGGNIEPAVLNAEAASRSYIPGPIQAGTWHVVVGKAKVVERPASYRITITLRDEPTLPAQARRPWTPPAPLEVGQRWYAGDFHVHSRESGDAQATLDKIADLARERGLDFVVITDHNTVSHLDFLVDAQARHPDVLLIPGMEFTTYDGHANALGATAWVDHKIGQPGITLEGAAQAFAAQGALLSVNHPTLDLGDLCIGCAWAHDFPEELAAIEIATGGLAQTGGLFTWSAIELWDELCAEGRRLAALGGSDDHRAGASTSPLQSPIGDPTTLVLANELSVDGILAGVAAGHTVVKLQGPGDPFVAIEAHGLEVTATVEGGVGHALKLVVDGQRRPAVPVDADPFAHVLTVEPGQRVRAEVHVDGAPRTVTSHLWPEAAPASVAPEDKGCGCTTTSLTGGWPWLVVLAVISRQARRARWRWPGSSS